MSFDSTPIQRVLDDAAAQRRYCLLEHEVYAVLNAAGCTVPAFILVKPEEKVEAGQLEALPGSEVILKVVSPEIAHKTDVGGVRKVQATRDAIASVMRDMLDTIPGRYVEWLQKHPVLTPDEFKSADAETIRASIRESIQGFLVVEKVAMVQAGPGSEVLVGLRHNREFGPVLTLGVGGVDTELLGSACVKGKAVVSCSPEMLTASEMLGRMKSTLAYRRLAGLTRGGEKLVEDSEIETVLRAFRHIATTMGTDETEGWTITELEVNPFAVANAGG